MTDNVNFIYIDNKKVELKKDKETVDQSSLSQDSAKVSIFNKLNKTGSNGQKDNVLDKNELSDFERKVRQYAGEDNNLSAEEARAMLDEMGLNDVDPNKLFDFIKTALGKKEETQPEPKDQNPLVTYAKNGETFDKTAERLGLKKGTEEYNEFVKANQEAKERHWFKVGEQVIIPSSIKDKVKQEGIISEKEGNAEVEEWKDSVKKNKPSAQPNKSSGSSSSHGAQGTTPSHKQTQTKKSYPAALQKELANFDKLHAKYTVKKNSNGTYTLTATSSDWMKKNNVSEIVYVFDKNGKRMSAQYTYKNGNVVKNTYKDDKIAKTQKFKKSTQTPEAAAKAKVSQNAKAGQALAQKLYNQIEGASQNAKTISLLKQINKDNVIYVLDTYSKLTKGNESLAQAVDNEWGLGATEVKQYICKPLVELAKQHGVKGIYYGDYMKLNDITAVNKWIENAKNKLKIALNINPDEVTVLNKKAKKKQDKPTNVDEMAQSYNNLQSSEYNKWLGKALFKQISGLSSPEKTRRLLNKVNSQNIYDVMKEYEKQSGGKENLIDAIADEYGLTCNDLKKIGVKLFAYGRSKGLNLNKYNAEFSKADDVKTVKNILNRIYNDINAKHQTTSQPSMRKYLDKFGDYNANQQFEKRTGISLDEAILRDPSISKKEKISTIRNTFTELTQKAKSMGIDVSDIINNANIDWQTLNNDNDFEKYIPLCVTTINKLNVRLASKSNDVKYPANGKIDHNFSQKGTGDCWLLASIKGIAMNPKGLKILNDSITVNSNGTVTVHLKGVNKTYIISQKEIDNAKELSSGDGDVRALEIAVNRYIREAYKDGTSSQASIDGNKPLIAYQILTGKGDHFFPLNSNGDKWLNPEFYGREPVTDEEIDGFNNKDKITCVWTGKDKDNVPLGNKADKIHVLRKEHAYTVVRSDKNYVYLINPWDTSTELKVDRQTFKRFFDRRESFTL